jgi:Fe-S cluster assembly protein SufD
VFNNYQAAFDSLPPAARTSARRAALDAFMQLGFPLREQEDWKYTDLSPLLTLDTSALGLAGPFTPGTKQPVKFRDGLDALNAAFCGEGLNQTVAAGRKLTDPIVLSGPGHQRHLLKLERGAEAILLLDTSKADGFQTVFADIKLAAGAQLQLLRLNDPAVSAHVVTRITVKLERDAQLRAVSADLGGKLSRHDLEVSLDAAGAQAHLAGLYLPSGDSFVDNHTRIDHRAPHGTSRELFRGIVMDRAQAVFNGKIVVHPNARKTDSEQHVANLLLSPNAQVNAKPELQIDNDDVKCAHGATCGQLDDNAIYYLRSRGLPLETARNVLLYTFAHEVLKQIPLESVRKRVEQLVLARLPGGGVAGDQS